MEQGIIKLIKVDQGYGFITRPDGTDLFFHCTECLGKFTRAKCALRKGMTVEYGFKQGKKAQEAKGVRSIEEESKQEEILDDE